MSYIQESVVYTIYPLGFCGAPKENDGVLCYRLNKLYDCIDHFKKLSVNALVLNPLFESSRHGYDTIDYRRVDCRLGDNQSFKGICAALHKNGIKVILDGVFNHVGRDFFAFRDLQQNLEHSRYRDWFQNVDFGGRSPAGDSFWYEGWAGHYDLVKLNLRNSEVVSYLLDSVRFWIDEFDIDGLRLDAADCVDPDFWKKLRALCKSKKQDFWLYGEIIHGDYNRWANKDALDSVTNYECYKGLYSSHNDHNYFEIAHSLNRQFGPGGIYRSIYTFNFADNHDVDRLASQLQDKHHLQNVYTLLYTMPGVPSLYYGSEFGIEGRRTQTSDYALRPCLDLRRVENGNYALFNHLVRLGRIRHSLEALKYGSFENVNIMNEKLVYKRQTGSQTVFVAFNLAGREDKLRFSTGCVGVLTDVLNENESFSVNGLCELSMKPYSSRILVVNDGSFRLDLAESKLSSNRNDLPAVQPLREVQLGRYRHFKGNTYEVIAIAKHTETGDALVIYRDVHAPEKVWARPYEMFTQVTQHEGQQVLRFTPLF